MALMAMYDACVLYPSTLRDFLLRSAGHGLVHARWTEAILDEVFDNLRDFPYEQLNPWDIRAVAPDDVVLELSSEDVGSVAIVLAQVAAA